MNTSLILYGTVGCHLCEQAKGVVESAGLSADHIDITDDDALYERYGIRIPVLLRADNGSELGWPFDTVKVLRFLS
jgi:glutaredoxin